MATGIKETKDIFLCLKGCATAIKAAKKDGKVDWKDALNSETRALIPLAIDMVKNSPAIVIEMGDLDAAEVKELVDLSVETGAALVEALLS